jgi:glycoprotein GP40
MGKYILVICAILCFGLAGVAIAQEKAQDPQKSETTAPPAAKMLSGEVTSIDAAKNDVVIKDEKGAEVHILIATSTKITKAGKTIGLADLKVGDKLSTECEDSATGCKAKTIAITPPTEDK